MATESLPLIVGLISGFGGYSSLPNLTNSAAAETIEKLHPTACGPVAQLGARFHGMEEVIGSIPIRSTN